MKTQSVMLAALLTVAACGGASSDAEGPGSTIAVTTAPEDATPPTTPLATSAVSSVATTVAPVPTTTAAPIAAVADARSIEDAVDVRIGTADDFAALGETQPVAVGDVVRTDRTGYAEIAYFDGSMTRLDVDTEFEVIALVDEIDESVVRTRMGIGRTWHRVSELGETGEFSVETAVATAVVQGTAFSVDCPTDESCTFMVIEGALRIDLPDGTSVELVAPAALTIDEDGAGDTVPVPFDGALTDLWLIDNAVRDVTAGFDAGAVVYEAHGPSFGSIVGTFTGTRTVVGLECFGVCPPEDPVGHVADRSYTFDIDCSAGVPCTGRIETEYVDVDVLTTAALPVEFDGTSFRWTLAYSGPSCFFDDGTADGGLDTAIEWTMNPSAAEIIDDRWVVTAMTGSGSAVNTVTDPGSCDPRWQAATQRSEFAVSRLP